MNQAEISSWVDQAVAAFSQARADAAGSWPLLRSLLSDPLPIITRTLLPKKVCAAAAFTRVSTHDDPSRRLGS